MSDEYIKKRSVKDPIHGMMSFDQYIWDIIDTPTFQRLRDIKQLGTTFYVFPGATHSRFEHCLGTAHLSNMYLDELEKNSDLSIDKKQFKKYKKLLEIAGLCHDLGHGPFSHMFDNELLPKIRPQNSKPWKHENGSQMMLEQIFKHELPKDYFEKNDIDPVKDLQLIQELIDGENQSFKNEVPQWVFEIISNKTSSIDVDKLDYIKRDSYHVGLQGYDYDFNILMKESRIKDGKLAYHQKHYYTIFDLFQSRYKLYKQIYQHRVTQGIELQICDALQLANEVYHLENCIEDPLKYLNLTDNILHEIQVSNDERLSEAKELLLKIKKRNIYKFVSEKVIEPTDIKPDEVKEYIKINYQVDEKDMEVIISKTNFCKKNENPLKYVKFYGSNNDVESDINQNNISLLMPTRFEEKTIRIFCKNLDNSVNEKIMENIEKGFKAFIKHKFEQHSYNDIGYSKTSAKNSTKRKLHQKIDEKEDKIGDELDKIQKKQKI